MVSQTADLEQVPFEAVMTAESKAMIEKLDCQSGFVVWGATLSESTVKINTAAMLLTTGPPTSDSRILNTKSWQWISTTSLGMGR